jgi:hypothetical protein
VIIRGRELRRNHVMYRTSTFRRFYLTLRGGASVLVASLIIAGCGTSRTLIRGASVRYTPGGVRTLARESLPGGAYIAIAALRYEFMGRLYSRLGIRFESPGAHGLVSAPGWDGGPRLESGTRSILVMNVSRSCNGRDATAVAYGLLRDPRDTVAAQQGGVSKVFRETEIPAIFHPGGVLVYALLASDVTHIIVRAPNGRIVSEMSPPRNSPCE